MNYRIYQPDYIRTDHLTKNMTKTEENKINLDLEDKLNDLKLMASGIGVTMTPMPFM